jgi:hypothetical protein
MRAKITQPTHIVREHTPVAIRKPIITDDALQSINYIVQCFIVIVSSDSLRLQLIKFMLRPG